METDVLQSIFKLVFIRALKRRFRLLTTLATIFEFTLKRDANLEINWVLSWLIQSHLFLLRWLLAMRIFVERQTVAKRFLIILWALLLLFLLEWIEGKNSVIISPLTQLIELSLLEDMKPGFNDILKLVLNCRLQLFCHLPVVAVVHDFHPFGFSDKLAVAILSSFEDKMGSSFECHTVRPDLRII